MAKVIYFLKVFISDIDGPNAWENQNRIVIPVDLTYMDQQFLSRFP